MRVILLLARKNKTGQITDCKTTCLFCSRNVDWGEKRQVVFYKMLSEGKQARRDFVYLCRYYYKTLIEYSQSGRKYFLRYFQ